MYRKEQRQDTSSKEFELPFGGKLASDNRWVVSAVIIPRSEFEGEYAAIFTDEIGAHFDKINDHQRKHLEWH